MNAIRWWIFCRMSEIAWWICPEPQRSDIQAATPTWGDYERRVAERLAEHRDNGNE